MRFLYNIIIYYTRYYYIMKIIRINKNKINIKNYNKIIHYKNKCALRKYNKYNQTSCYICLEKLCSEKCIVLKCNHIFHSSCILKWYEANKKCPLCKI